MINSLHKLLHDPQRGWDPISEAYAMHYSEKVATVDASLIAALESALAGLARKRLLDLGSGPGQYAIELARRGASLTCVDVSARYLAMVRQRFDDAGLDVTLKLGYMDDVGDDFAECFDGIFNNVAWYYAVEDLGFAAAILRALKPGGVALIYANTEAFERTTSFQRRAVYWLNRRLHWKIGHPHPPRGRIAESFERIGGCRVEACYDHPINDRVIIRKS